MTVTNKTSVALEILGGSLKPNESREYTEMMFNTLDIHSEIGSCVITTEYGQRSFRNYGKLVAKEGRKKNEHGMKKHYRFFYRLISPKKLDTMPKGIVFISCYTA